MDAALFIVHPPGDHFAAIEGAAAVTGLPVVRVAREIDPKVRRSGELGFLNGHVPITAVLSAAAVVAAVLGQRDAVVLSNERSASVPTLLHAGQPVNHQWSKGEDFERGFAHRVAGCGRARALGVLLPAGPLRALGGPGIRRAHRFHRSSGVATDPSTRTPRSASTAGAAPATSAVSSTSSWPPSSRRTPSPVFAGREPLENQPDLGTASAPWSGWRSRPSPSSASATSTNAAPRCPWRRCADPVGVTAVAATLRRAGAAPGVEPATVLAPAGPHHIPDRYAPADLLV